MATCTIGVSDKVDFKKELLPSHFWCRIDGELQLGLFAVVHGEALHEEGGEAGAGAAAEGVEEEEALEEEEVPGEGGGDLEAGALVRQLPHPVQHQVHHLEEGGAAAGTSLPMV